MPHGQLRAHPEPEQISLADRQSGQLVVRLLGSLGAAVQDEAQVPSEQQIFPLSHSDTGVVPKEVTPVHTSDGTHWLLDHVQPESAASSLHTAGSMVLQYVEPVRVAFLQFSHSDSQLMQFPADAFHLLAFQWQAGRRLQDDAPWIPAHDSN